MQAGRRAAKHLIWRADAVIGAEGNIECGVSTRRIRPHDVQEPGMYGNSLSGSREISWFSAVDGRGRAAWKGSTVTHVCTARRSLILP